MVPIKSAASCEVMTAIHVEGPHTGMRQPLYGVPPTLIGPRHVRISSNGELFNYDPDKLEFFGK